MNRALALAVLLAASVAFADSKEAGPPEEFTRFVSVVQSDGKENFIRPNVGPLLGLEPNAPSKAFVIDVVKEEKGVKLGRACNVLKADGTVVFLHYTRKKRGNVGRYFKTNAEGILLSAIETNSKNDDAGNAVRGSGVKKELKITSSSTKKAFKEELKFWLSGEYKKHLPAAK